MSRRARHGRDGDERLADMAVEPELYVEPLAAECDFPPLEYPLEIQPGVSIYVYQLEQHRQLRMFSLQLSAMVDGLQETISRIDTRHGCVHQHFYRQGVYDPARPRKVFSTIPADHPEAHLEHALEQSFEILMDDWEALIARWQ